MQTEIPANEHSNCQDVIKEAHDKIMRLETGEASVPGVSISSLRK